MTGIRVAHAIPGRFRLQIPALKGNPTLGRELAEHVWSLSGVRWVETNPTTGSLIVLYETPEAERWRDEMDDLASSLAPLLPDPDARAVAEWLAAPGSADSLPALQTERVGAFFRTVNERVGSATGGTDLAFLVPAALVFLGLQRLVFVEKLHVPQWYDLLWFGLGTFMMFNAAAAARGPAVAGPDAGSTATPGRRQRRPPRSTPPGEPDGGTRRRRSPG